MFASLHEADHLGKAIETRSLSRPQWMRLEERHHSPGQLLKSSDAELLSITMVRGDLTTPQNSRSCSRSATSLSCCTTRNSGRTCQPTFIVGCRLMPTKKHPSPSTKPTTQSGLRLSCWLSAPIGLSLITEYHRIHQSSQQIAGCTRRHYWRRGLAIH